jgi:GNAT superfamily N-acetyltransferase
VARERISKDEKIRRALRKGVDSWVPFDLNELDEEEPVKPTLGATQLLYPGKRHVFSGPPESAKTLAAYCFLIQTVRQEPDELVALFDFEMGPRSARQRLRELGASQDEIRRVLYLEPEDRSTPERLKAIVELNPALVVVDAAAGAYELEGLNDNNRDEVETFNRKYVKTFWREGIATLLIDHVVKSAEERGKYSIGSERKLGATDVHLGFETVKAISRGTTGRYKIITHKDRDGFFQRGHLADLHLDSDPETHAIAWKFTSADTVGEDGIFRPTHLMEKASIQIETAGVAPTKTELAAALGGRKDYALQAIDRLVAEGFAVSTADGRSKIITSTRRYRENDPDCNPETLAAPAPTILCQSP